VGEEVEKALRRKITLPELPEVETIRRELARKIINKRIISCSILRKDVIEYPGPASFRKSITGEEITAVIRRAKYLIIELTNQKRLIFHFRLSGTVLLKKSGAAPERFTRVIIGLNGLQLFFNEPRVLGRIYLQHRNKRYKTPKGLYTLGYEPISPEFDFNYLRSKIKGRKARIKSLLLDQRICAGVGNIYSDEALFHAGITPLRRADRLTTEEILKLIFSLKDVLNKAIDNFGTSVSDYHRINGKEGNFQKYLYVYSREGEPCRICGTEIALTKISNRSTRFCPKCQK